MWGSSFEDTDLCLKEVYSSGVCARCLLVSALVEPSGNDVLMKVRGSL